jgi:hypothetical protein
LLILRDQLVVCSLELICPVAASGHNLSSLVRQRGLNPLTTIASAQDAQEKAANRRRTQAPVYQVGDKVWLNMENIKTDRPYKKLDQRYMKFTIREVCGLHTYRLGIPPGVHNVFPTWLLHPVSGNPLLGQIIREPQLPSIPLMAIPNMRTRRSWMRNQAEGGTPQSNT